MNCSCGKPMSDWDRENGGKCLTCVCREENERVTAEKAADMERLKKETEKKVSYVQCREYRCQRYFSTQSISSFSEDGMRGGTVEKTDNSKKIDGLEIQVFGENGLLAGFLEPANIGLLLERELLEKRIRPNSWNEYRQEGDREIETGEWKTI